MRLAPRISWAQPTRLRRLSPGQTLPGAGGPRATAAAARLSRYPQQFRHDPEAEVARTAALRLDPKLPIMHYTLGLT